MDLRFEELNPTKSSSLLKLFNSIYPALDWSPHYMDWQYYQNPAGKARNWVAVDGDTLIANVTAIPHVLTVKGQRSLAWRIQDVMTNSAYRGKWVFSSLL